MIWSILRFLRAAVIALALALAGYVGYLASYIDQCVARLYDAGRNPDMAEMYNLVPASSWRDVRGRVFYEYLAPCDFEQYRSHIFRAQLGLVFQLFWGNPKIWGMARGFRDGNDWATLLEDEGIDDIRATTEPQRRCLIRRFLDGMKRRPRCAVDYLGRWPP